MGTAAPEGGPGDTVGLEVELLVLAPHPELERVAHGHCDLTGILPV